MPHANRIFLPGPARHSPIATGGILFRRNCGESFGDAQRRKGPGVHPLHVGQQLRAAVQQFGFVAPVKRVGHHKIPDAHAIAHDELPHPKRTAGSFLGSSSTIGDYLN
jgi:hypothetical protein